MFWVFNPTAFWSVARALIFWLLLHRSFKSWVFKYAKLVCYMYTIYAFLYGPDLWVIPLWYFIFLSRNWKGSCQAKGDSVEDCIIIGGQTSPHSFPTSLSLSYPSRVVPSNSRDPVAWCMKTEITFILLFFVCCGFCLKNIHLDLILCVVQLQAMVRLLFFLGHACTYFDAAAVAPSSLRHSTSANISTLVSLIIFLKC